MAVTAGTIILDALQEIGVYNANETLSSTDAAKGLTKLNQMMDSWSNESLTTFCTLEQSITLVAGTAQYPVGPGSPYASVRPLRIPEGPGMARIRDTNLNDYDVTVLTQVQWNQIGLKTTNSDIPDSMWYDPQYPVGYINIFPKPSQPYTLFFDSYAALQEFSNLTTALSLPPGYQEAITLNLAARLWRTFLDGAMPADLRQDAADAKKIVKRTNFRPTVARYDPEIVSNASPTYNIYRDRAGGN